MLQQWLSYNGKNAYIDGMKRMFSLSPFRSFNEPFSPRLLRSYFVSKFESVF
ncbi:MAG: hypothetical protein LC102_04005 [Ignavibacteriales bacterium]|nr:hypothetical protein [Ignavibacteriaceae bacterium]MCZ2142575.1 hypothetical protein [Ignavibacteriales bacterium]